MESQGSSQIPTTGNTTILGLIARSAPATFGCPFATERRKFHQHYASVPLSITSNPVWIELQRPSH